MEHLLIRHRLVNKTAIDDFVGDAFSSSTKQLKFLSTWPKGFRKVMLKTYAEFIELKLVNNDCDSNVIVAPYPLKRLWCSHSYHYNSICQKLFKKKILYNSAKETDEQIQYTLNAYKLRFNREPRYWDFIASKQIWDKRIHNWDKRKRLSRQLNNRFLNSEKSSINAASALNKEKIKSEDVEIEYKNQGVASCEVKVHNNSVNVSSNTVCVDSVANISTGQSSVHCQIGNVFVDAPNVINCLEGQIDDISNKPVKTKKIMCHKRKILVTPFSCVTRSKKMLT